MNPEKARQLLGGLAAGILTPEERQTLFEAALHDQSIFNEVADELEFAAFLQSPQTRAQLANRIEVEPVRKSRWRLHPAWLGLSGVAAASVVVYVAVSHRTQEPVVEKPAPVAAVEEKQQPAAPPAVVAAKPKPLPTRHLVRKAVASETAPAAPGTAPEPPAAPTAAAPRAMAPMAFRAAPGIPPQPAPYDLSLSGSVHDPAGAAIPGATIEIVDPSTNTNSHATSDSNGRFSASSLAPGAYTLIASAPGFEKTQRSVTVDPNQTASVDIPLRPGTAAQAVAVAATPRAAMTQVAVLDFVNSGEPNPAGAKVADLVATELKKGGQVGVVDRKKVQAAQDQSTAGKPPSVQQAAAVGRTVGADAVVMGSVQPPGSVTAQVIDAKKAASVSTVEARAPSLQAAALSLGNQIQSNFAKTLEGSVINRKGRVVTVTFDAASPPVKGTRGDVFHDGRKIGELVITAMEGNTATATYQGSGHPRAGDRVRISSVP